MNRRIFIGLLAALPFIRKLKVKPSGWKYQQPLNGGAYILPRDGFEERRDFYFNLMSSFPSAQGKMIK